MSTIKRLIKAEIYRHVHSPATMILSVILVYFSYCLRQNADYLSFDAEIVLADVYRNYTMVLWQGIFLSAQFFNGCFGSRTYNGAVYGGCSRTQIVSARALVYYLWGLLIDMGTMWWIIGINRTFQRVYVLTGTYVISRLLFHILCLLAVMTIPMLLAFLCKDVFRSMAFSGGFAFLTQVLIGRWDFNMESLVYKLNPAFRMVNPFIWIAGENEAGLAYLMREAIVPILCFAGGLALSIYLFRRMELK